MRHKHSLNLLLLATLLIACCLGLRAQTSLNVSMSSTPACSLSGTVTATVTNGVPPYTYSWYGPMGSIPNNSPTLTGVSGGGYYVSVNDANQMFGWGQATVAYPFQLDVTWTNDQCNTAVGTATATVTSGGTPPFSYLWSNGGTGATITGLTQGDYHVTVTDANGCFVESGQDSSFVAYVGNSSPVSFNISTTSATCSNGTATVTGLAGGTPPYTYFWNLTPAQFGPAATNLPGGTYSYCIVTDAGGCATTRWFYINQLPSGVNLSVSEVDETCIQANGSATVVASGGTPPYTYLWSTGATTATASGLSYGWYQVTVLDANLCQASASASIGRTDPLTLAISSVPPTCGNTNGAASVAVSGGTPPYTYQWHNGATAASISGLGFGYYAVTVTDANGCYDHQYVFNGMPATCYGTLSGSIVGDLNGNCVDDLGDFGFPSRLVSLGGLYAFTDAGGDFTRSALPGSYVVSQPTVPNYFAQGCPVPPGNYNVTLAAQQVVSNLDFFNGQASVVNDLSISLVAQPARTTAPQQVWLYYQNVGSTVLNATIEFVHDPLMTLYSPGPSLTAYNSGTRTCTYALGPVAPGQSGVVQSSFVIPTTTPLGTAYTMYAEIQPVGGDATPSDNVVTQAGTTVAAYDPNDKAVSPGGLLALDDTVLTYTVRFQNTGNDTAFNVLIRDTIDTDLDIFSFEMVGASHPYVLDAETPGVILFHFPGIMLPDSNINEPASHGHLVYRIRLKDGLPLGTEIRNTAAIYFDYNAPVITNTTVSTYGLVSVDPSAGGRPDFAIFPNPASDAAVLRLGYGWSGMAGVSVMDMGGRTLLRYQLDADAGSEQQLQLGDLPAGLYMVECRTETRRSVRRLVIQ